MTTKEYMEYKRAMEGIGGWIDRKTGSIYRKVKWGGNYYAINDNDYKEYNAPNVEAFEKAFIHESAFCNKEQFAVIPCIHPCYAMAIFVQKNKDRYKTVFSKYNLFVYSTLYKCPVFFDPTCASPLSKDEIGFWEACSIMLENHSEIEEEYNEYDEKTITPSIICKSYNEIIISQKLSD